VQAPRRYGNSERFGGSEIDDHFEFGRLPGQKKPYANILTISANRQLAYRALYLLTMRGLKHFIGCVGIAITLDYLAFNGYCTEVCTHVLSLACDQMLSEAQVHVRQFKTFL